MKVIKEVFPGETSRGLEKQAGVGRKPSKVVISGKILRTVFFIPIPQGSTRQVNCELGFHTPVTASD